MSGSSENGGLKMLESNASALDPNLNSDEAATLYRRHLCSDCPANVTFTGITRGGVGNRIHYCCPKGPRRTVTKCSGARVTRTVTKTVTVRGIITFRAYLCTFNLVTKNNKCDGPSEYTKWPFSSQSNSGQLILAGKNSGQTSRFDFQVNSDARGHQFVEANVYEPEAPVGSLLQMVLADGGQAPIWNHTITAKETKGALDLVMQMDPPPVVSSKIVFTSFPPTRPTNNMVFASGVALPGMRVRCNVQPDYRYDGYSINYIAPTETLADPHSGKFNLTCPEMYRPVNNVSFYQMDAKGWKSQEVLWATLPVASPPCLDCVVHNATTDLFVVNGTGVPNGIVKWSTWGENKKLMPLDATGRFAITVKGSDVVSCGGGMCAVCWIGPLLVSQWDGYNESEDINDFLYRTSMCFPHQETVCSSDRSGKPACTQSDPGMAA